MLPLSLVNRSVYFKSIKNPTRARVRREITSDQFPAICIIRPRVGNRLIERLFPRRYKTSDSQPVSAGADNTHTHTCPYDDTRTPRAEKTGGVTEKIG